MCRNPFRSSSVGHQTSRTRIRKRHRTVAPLPQERGVWVGHIEVAVVATALVAAAMSWKAPPRTLAGSFGTSTSVGATSTAPSLRSAAGCRGGYRAYQHFISLPQRPATAPGAAAAAQPRRLQCSAELPHRVLERVGEWCKKHCASGVAGLAAASLLLHAAAEPALAINANQLLFLEVSGSSIVLRCWSAGRVTRLVVLTCWLVGMLARHGVRLTEHMWTRRSTTATGSSSAR